MISHELVLAVERVSFSYGVVPALIDVNISIGRGEIVGLLGPNGAGKTTLLRIISGLLVPDAGIVKLSGQESSRLSPWAIAARGVAHVPQGRRCFSGLTVEDNLIVGGYRLPQTKALAQLETTYEVFPVLRDKRRQLAAELSGGQQQMLAIGRAIMSAPDLLLLDEPSLGLSPKLVQQMLATLLRLSEVLRAGILLVEQNTRLALSASKRAYVMRGGRILLDADSATVASEVKALYFGQTARGSALT